MATDKKNRCCYVTVQISMEAMKELINIILFTETKPQNLSDEFLLLNNKKRKKKNTSMALCKGSNIAVSSECANKYDFIYRNKASTVLYSGFLLQFANKIPTTLCAVSNIQVSNECANKFYFICRNKASVVLGKEFLIVTKNKITNDVTDGFKYPRR